MSKKAAKRVFVLSPHADDAELGIGGYLARVVDEGGEVMVALATVGDVRHLHDTVNTTAQKREEEYFAAMSVLGIQHCRILTKGLDGELQKHPRGELVAMLDTLQSEFEPDEILLPLPSSHQDHVYCWEVGISMARPNAAKRLPSLVAGYEYPLTSWGPGSAFNPFTGGLYLNVTHTWERKLEALRQHQSQMARGDGHIISLEGVTALGRLRGIEAGYGYAELLHVVRQRWS